MSTGKPRFRLGKRLLGQYLLVFFAFLLMVLISSYFAGIIVNESTNAYGDKVLELSVERIHSLLEGYEIILDEIAFSIEELRTLYGTDATEIETELTRRLEWHIGRSGMREQYFAIYGVVDDTFIYSKDWIPSEDYLLSARPWYIGAYENRGTAYYSEPYTDARTMEEIISLSKLIYHDGEPFGVLAIDIHMSVLVEAISSMELMGSGYGVLLDNDRRLIVHPHEPLVGEHLSNLGMKDYEEIDRLLQEYEHIYGADFVSFEGIESVAFYKPLFNGWYIGIIAPVNILRNDITTMQLILVATGAVMMLILCSVLTLMHLAVNRSDEANRIKASLLENAHAQTAKVSEAHKRAKSMLDATPMGCVMWDKDLRIFDCNKEAAKLFGLKDEQEFMSRFHEIFPVYQPDGMLSIEKASMSIKNIFNDDQIDRIVFEFMNEQPEDGTPIPAEVTLVRVNYGDDIAVAGYIRDLREHKQMMEEIEYRNNLMSMENLIAEKLLTTETDASIDIKTLIIDSMAYLGSATDVDRIQIWKNELIDGELHFVNSYCWLSEAGKQKNPVPTETKLRYSERPEWENLFSRGQYISGLISEMPPGVQEFFAGYEVKAVVIIPLFLQEQLWGFFGIDDCKQKRTFTVEELHIMRSISMMFASAFLRNDMNIEIEEALEEARAASQAKSEFLSNMSHEIRTPMNTVLGMTELLMHEPLSSHQMDYVHDIRASGQLLLSIINDILDMSKIEAGKLELNPIHYNFNVFSDNIDSIFKHIAEKKNIDFQLECDPNVPEYLFGDDIRLKQVLTNLCGNAVKFTEKGYVRLKVAKDGDSLRFEIKDTGIGIRKEDIGKLFNAFEQSQSHKTRGIVGTGLGLAISKAFVEMMDGHITIDSEYGHGTVFTAVIPLIEGNEDEAKQNDDVERIIAPRADILVVDDNEFNLKVAQGLLSLSKIDAKIAFSGKDAIEMIRQHDYDIVFMDHMMPEMDGVEATGIIRSMGGKYEKLPIVALTANAIYGVRDMFLSSGFNGFVSKPIDMHELNEALKAWLPPEKIEQVIQPVTDGNSSESSFISVLYDIAEIDNKLGLSHAADIEDIYWAMIENFYNNLLPECEKSRTFLADGDILSFATSIHGMKSMLSTIGAMELSEAALELEMTAKKGEAAYCQAYFPELLEKLLALRKQLSVLFKD